MLGRMAVPARCARQSSYQHDAARSTDGSSGGSRVWAFRGDVRFSGHFGMLFVRVANPWLDRRF